MKDLHEGVLREFAERAQQGYDWKQNGLTVHLAPPQVSRCPVCGLTDKQKKNFRRPECVTGN